MNDIMVPISPGELLDKITILRIKVARIQDAAKLANVKLELRCWNRPGRTAAAPQRPWPSTSTRCRP